MNLSEGTLCMSKVFYWWIRGHLIDAGVKIWCFQVHNLHRYKWLHVCLINIASSLALKMINTSIAENKIQKFPSAEFCRSSANPGYLKSPWIIRVQSTHPQNLQVIEKIWTSKVDQIQLNEYPFFVGAVNYILVALRPPPKPCKVTWQGSLLWRILCILLAHLWEYLFSGHRSSQQISCYSALNCACLVGQNWLHGTFCLLLQLRELRGCSDGALLSHGSMSSSRQGFK